MGRSADQPAVESLRVQTLASPQCAAGLAEALPAPLAPRPLPELVAFETAPGQATLLVLDDLLLPQASPAWLRALPRWVVVVAASQAAAERADAADRLFLRLPEDADDALRRALLRAAMLHAVGLASAEQLRCERELADRDLFELSEVGAALMQSQEPEVLLARILTEARRVTASDAGSLYLVDEDQLRFRLVQNDSLDLLEPPGGSLAIDPTSFAGYAATTRETLQIQDAYRLPANAPYRFDRRFDEANGYRTGAVLAVPMCTPKGETIGVLQLLNPAAGSYKRRDQQIVRALGGQAAVSIENQRLRADIERLFEGFIRAAVTALDQRDPGTSGHSERVAAVTCALAERADGSSSRPFDRVRFSRDELRELRYAALLHDFGKVFVSEGVLGKDRKLPRDREASLLGRFQRGHEVLEARFHAERARYLSECGSAGFQAFEKRLRSGIDAERNRLRRFEAAVRRANEPRVLPAEMSADLAEMAGQVLVGADDDEFALLEARDLDYLAVPQGSLSPEERRAIQSHVVYTHRFLEQIPWTRDLARVDAIVWAHHEKLDGSGYPRRLGGEAIPIQTRMLTIADIFDALTAADRPYKKALPVEKALEILRSETAQGRVDADLMELFLASRVWQLGD
ncbi:MAG: phosphohydrolase [Deltaproteobacteria bacterium]|jgi:HD-GYP domain-containing protein (c-di-GMP phosphodiesterase class II)|nr:phosphohydrolase [Deltaproteobacteria bacterium]